MIEFECTNQIRDPLTGGNYPCGKRLIVPEEQMGESVICPKCQRSVEIPFPKKPPANAGSGASNPSAKRPGQAAKQPTRKANSEDELRLSDPFVRPKSDLSNLDIRDSETARPLPKDKRRRCQKCGAIADGALRCPSCGQKVVDRRESSQPIDQMKVGLAGFQLWFVRTIAESIPIRVLELGLHVSIAMIVLLFTFVALFAVGGLEGIGILLILGVLATAYVALIRKGHQLATDPHARLAWYQRPLWDAILWIARRRDWQGYDSRLDGRVIINCRGEGITDNHLPELEGLEKCQVLDLQDTPVTDQGLRHLYSLKHLHCVVLKHTGVTHEGVFRLQQARPGLWIWY